MYYVTVLADFYADYFKEKHEVVNNIILHNSSTLWQKLLLPLKLRI
jgi:hypothetical protein